MTIEKLPSGSYRIRKTYKGKTYTITTKYKPTQKEATILMAERMQGNEAEKGTKTDFLTCAQEYISNRSEVLSKSTIRSYNTLKNSLTSEFSSINIYDIDQTAIQKEINKYSKDHSPKSTYNMHGFISAILMEKRPTMVINTSLPQKAENKPYRATEKDIERILEASKDNPMYHICFQLGILSLRRGEVAALQLSDLNGTELSINKAMVETGEKGNDWIVQNKTKNDTSNRTIQIPQSLADEINSLGHIYTNTPPMLVQTLHSYQDKLGIKRFRFHDLRHYFASYAHSIGIPDVYIMEMGGWKTNHTLNKVYKEAMEDKSKDMKLKISNQIIPTSDKKDS